MSRESAPLFMGFKSALKKNQATEDAVTIAGGAFAGGTTMAVSHMRLRLDSWYRNLTDAERVARMYSPQTTAAEVARFTTDAESNPGLLTRRSRVRCHRPLADLGPRAPRTESH